MAGNARNKRLRVSVDVDIFTSTSFERLSQDLAARATAALAKSEAWKVHGVTVLNVSDGSPIARWEGSGREYKRVAVDTGEVLP